MKMIHFSIRPLLFVLSVLLLSGCTFGRQVAPTPIAINMSKSSENSVAGDGLLTVQRGDIVDSRTFPGKISLAIEEDLFFGVNGRVHKVHVESGDTVAEGDLIAELDTYSLQLDIELAEKTAMLAEHKVANAQELLAHYLRNAERNLEISELRLQALKERDVPDPIAIEIQALEVERAKDAVGRLESGIDVSMNVDLEQLTTNLDKAVVTLLKQESSLRDAQITAPFSGEVRFYESLGGGRSVQAVQSFEPVASIVDPESIQIEANLVNDDLELIFEGMPVQITPVNQPNLLLNGEVRRLPLPFGTGTGTLTEVSLGEDVASDGLRPGMSMEILVELDRSENTLWLPIEALHGFNQNYYVEVQEGATTVEAPVTIGLRNATQVEILSGLEEGDQVISQ